MTANTFYTFVLFCLLFLHHTAASHMPNHSFQLKRIMLSSVIIVYVQQQMAAASPCCQQHISNVVTKGEIL